MPEVMFAAPGEMNLLGHFLRSLIERNLQTERGTRALGNLKGTVLVGASKMRVTLEFGPDRLVIHLGDQGSPDAQVMASLETLLRVALGRGMLGPLLSGQIQVRGKVWRLLPLLQLLGAEEEPRP